MHAALADGWQLWRCACLRSTGFPVRLLLALHTPDVAASADLWLARDRELQAAAQRALQLCDVALSLVSGDERKELVRSARALRAGRPPASSGGSPLAGALEAHQSAYAAREEQRREVERQLDLARLRTSSALREIGRDPRFREALLWQNPGALRNGVGPLLRKPVGASDSKTRQHEWIVARYLQRYCAKNDTIGFFGPVGWARVGERAGLLHLELARESLSKRTVYFEYWCAAALAAAIAADTRILPDLPPRRVPWVRLEGTRLHHPVGQVTDLPPTHARLLGACDGVRSAREIASQLVAAAGSGSATEDEVYAGLEELVEAGVLIWTLELPPNTCFPERDLRAALLRLQDEAARRRATGMLRELEAARDRVAAAAGNEPELAGAIEALEKTFTHLTGQPARRHDGASYAGRTLVFEDCRWAGQLELGDRFRERLGPPLALLMQSARWYTYTIAMRYLAALRDLYRRLCGGTAAPHVDYLSYWERARELFPGSASSAPSIARDVTAELQARWDSVLHLDPSSRREQRLAAELRDRVQRSFAAPQPGWPNARHCSPDVLIAASPAQRASGEGTLVIGEVHPGFNTLHAPFLLKEHPYPEAMIRAREHDLPDPCVGHVWSQARSRSDFYSASRHDLDLENGDTRSARSREQVLTAAELVVADIGGELMVCSRDGKHSIHVIAFIEQHLIAESYAGFQCLAPRRHSPRVSIDEVVLSREHWRMEPADVAFAHLDQASARFIEARRWRELHALPRWAFYKVPHETKPCFVDFEVPLHVELFSHQIRKASEVALSEMLPSFGECWLTDAEGDTYTSELRLGITDPRPWSARMETAEPDPSAHSEDGGFEP